MSNSNKSKKDKEILAEYESQVKGTTFIIITLTIIIIMTLHLSVWLMACPGAPVHDWIEA